MHWRRQPRFGVRERDGRGQRPPPLRLDMLEAPSLARLSDTVHVNALLSHLADFGIISAKGIGRVDDLLDKAEHNRTAERRKGGGKNASATDARDRHLCRSAKEGNSRSPFVE
jgi:hypothetical protein